MTRDGKKQYKIMKMAAIVNAPITRVKNII
jgi:hypothetical protein